MDIDVPVRELGDVDISSLRDAILAQEEAAWHEDEYRQQTYDVHLQTQSIVLLFTDGSDWPDPDIRKEPGWDRLADVAVPIMDDILAKHYPPGGTIIRAMAAPPVVSLRPSHPHPDPDKFPRALHDRRAALQIRGRAGL
jgi:hypothetical protein